MLDRSGTRRRTNFTEQQEMILRRLFSKSHFPTSIQKRRVSNLLNISHRAIQVWFQNKRQKSKALTEPAPERRDNMVIDSTGRKCVCSGDICRRRCLYALSELSYLEMYRRFQRAFSKFR